MEGSLTAPAKLFHKTEAATGGGGGGSSRRKADLMVLQEGIANGQRSKVVTEVDGSAKM